MNTEMRRKDRMVTDKAQIESIISNAKILHLGLTDDDFPYVVPLHYGYEYDEEKRTYLFYIHAAKEGRKLDLINKNPNVCVELETGMELVSGGDDPCEYSSYFSSVIGKGKASILENSQEKKHALELLMINQTGRTFEFTEQMVSTVKIIKVELLSFTAKAYMKKQ